MATEEIEKILIKARERYTSYVLDRPDKLYADKRVYIQQQNKLNELATNQTTDSKTIEAAQEKIAQYLNSINTTIEFIKAHPDKKSIMKLADDESPEAHLIMAIKDNDDELFEASIAAGANIAKLVNGEAPLVCAATNPGNPPFKFLWRLLNHHAMNEEVINMPHQTGLRALSAVAVAQRTQDQDISTFQIRREAAMGELMEKGAEAGNPSVTTQASQLNPQKNNLQTRADTALNQTSLQPNLDPLRTTQGAYKSKLQNIHDKRIDSTAKSEIIPTLTKGQQDRVQAVIDNLKKELPGTWFYKDRKNAKINALEKLINDCKNGTPIIDAINKARNNTQVTAGRGVSRTAALLNELEIEARNLSQFNTNSM